VSELVGDVRLEIFNGSGKGRNDGVSLLCRRGPSGEHQDKKDSSFHGTCFCDELLVF
jgi:hypothetical protein